MLRKTALLAGVAAAFLISAPALAQDPAPSQTPDAPATQTAPAAPQSLTLQPGATVRGSDGAELGKLEGARRNAAGQQELTVRGTDGLLRAVPLNGLKQDGADVVVGWTTAEYQAATSIEAEGDASDDAVPPATPSEGATPASPAVPAQPGVPGEAAQPAVPAVPATPVEPDQPADAMETEPETPAEPQR